jgi:DNA repair protein RadC
LDYLYLSMGGLKREVFGIFFLNSRHQIIEIEDFSKGTVTSSQVPLRRVFENAIRYNASSLVFFHNHPSGNTKPSLQDKEQTRELVFGGAIMGIKILDHIIIGGDGFFSFAEEGLIEQYETDFLKVKGASEARRQ